MAWLVGTVGGVVGATAIGEPTRWGLDVLFPVFYLSLLLPELFPEHLQRRAPSARKADQGASSGLAPKAPRNFRPIIVAVLDAVITPPWTSIAPSGGAGASHGSSRAAGLRAPPG